MAESRGKLRAGTEPIEDCFYNIRQQEHVHIVLNFHKMRLWNTYPEKDICTENDTYLEVIKDPYFEVYIYIYIYVSKYISVTQFLLINFQKFN
jgi:hypothetical protein